MKLKIQTWNFLLMLFMAKEALCNKNTSAYLIPCEEGWYLFRDKCYTILGKTEGVDWKSAEVSCADHHGSLVTIQSRELQEFLTTFLLMNAKSDVWIGLNDVQIESQFTWSDGSIVNFTNWEYGEPNNDQEEDCGELRYFFSKGLIGDWNDNKCDTKWPFMCQKNKNELIMNKDPRFCPGENNGAWKYDNFCYHIVNEEMSWDDAENYCQTVLTGHLLSIVDDKVEYFVKHALPIFSRKFWIGIKIRDAAQQMWTSKWNLYLKKWENHEILNKIGSCAYMTEAGLWSSTSCSRKLPFVCEVLQDKPPVKQAPEGWRCPELSQDWIDLGGENCYIFETKDKQKWHEANFACMKKGGHLAVIDSVAEEIAIHRRIIGVHERMLIGLHRSLSNNSVFEWVDGTLLDYQHWDVGEPNNIKKEACGEIWTSDMTWNDFMCGTPKEYICSAKKVPPFGYEPNCSGNAIWNITLALLSVAVVISVVGFTIYIYRNQYRKRFQRWKEFALSFSAKSGTASKEFLTDNIIEQNEFK